MSNEGIEIEVYGFADPTVLKGTLRGVTEPKVLEEIKNIGGGSFKISTRDKQIVKDPTLVKNRNVVKHRVDGKVIGAWLIGSRDAITLGENAAQEGYEIAGGGLKAWLDDARVEPLGGFKKTSKDSRSFSFASEAGDWYIPAQWIDPYPIARVEGSTMWQFGPDKWPEGATGAQWVWGTPGSNPVASTGNNYFRMTITLAVATDFKLYVAADDNYSVYLDGAEVAKTDDLVDNWKEASKISLSMEAGTHVIGIRVTNIRGAAGLAAALYKLTERVPPVAKGTVTIPIGSTPTYTSTNHGITVPDTKIHFTTTGTLPGGLQPNKDYYATRITANTFYVRASPMGNQFATSGTQSGTHTLHISEINPVEKLVTYTGMTVASLTAALSAANATVTTRQNYYNSLPAGSKTGTTAQKKQAQAKATALANLQIAQQARNSIQTELTAANAMAGQGITWKVLPYPAKAPGWTPGEILLTLLEEAAARGVRMASLLTPNFTTTHDSEGEVWDEPIDWTFSVGKDTLLTVANRMEEMGCDIWIDPDTYALNVVNRRGVDRSIYQYDVDGITVLKSPVIFRVGKNLRRTQIKSQGKIKNNLAIKTQEGWQPIPEQDDDSVSLYGVIEGTLDTNASPALSQTLADVIFVQRANEEEGASYDVYLPPEGLIPHVDFKVGDWVLAPDEQGLLVRRRIMSISTEMTPSAGRAMYTLEFDTIFRDNEDRINRVLQKLGGGGVGSAYTNAGGVGSTSPSSPIIIPPSEVVPTETIPAAPTDLEVFSIGYWSSNGVKPYGQVNITWAPVTQNTDGTEMIPAYYEVWGRPTAATDDAWVLFSTVSQPSASLEAFEPGTDWTFYVLAWNQTRSSSRSDEVVHTVLGPTDPMLAPSVPVLSSDKGVLLAAWDGLLSNGEPPPAQFRYLYVEARQAGSTTAWQRVGPTMGRDGRQIPIVGLPVGFSVEARFVALDGAGIPSAPSDPSLPHTITGVDLGDLDAAVTDAIEAAEAAAEAAQNTATAAQIAAGLAQDDVDTLELDVDALALEVADVLATAEDALSTASGMVTWSPNAPLVGDGAGKPVDAIWYRTSANGIIGQWRWNGTAWVSSPIDSDAIFSINAVKITAGTLDAARIAANSIATSKLLVGSLNNLIPDPNFLNPTQSGWNAAVHEWMVGGGRTTGTNAIRITATGAQKGAYNPTNIPVQEGDIYYLSVWVKPSADLPAGSNLLGPYFQIDRVGTTQTTGGLNNSAVILANVWTKITGTMTIPATGYRVRAGLYLQAIVPAGVTVDFTEPEMLRVSGTTLIADGAITTDKIVALAITAAKIAAGTITGDKVAAGTISTSKLMVTSLENLIEDGGFEYHTTATPSWTLTAGATIQGTNVRTGTKSLQVTGGVKVAATSVAAFRVEQNEQYRLEAWVRLSTGVMNATDGITLRMTYGSVEGTTTTITSDIVPTPDNATTTYIPITGVWVVPTGAKFARLQVIQRDTDTAKIYFVDDLAVYKMGTGELIVDGSITAPKIGAAQIIGQHIVAEAIDGEKIRADSIATRHVQARAIEAEQIAVRAIQADHVDAGAIKTQHISSEVGQELNIENNTSINFVVGEINNVQGNLDSTNDNLELMQTYYQFGPDGALISKPGSVFATAIRNDRIEMLENGNVISYWNSGTLYVNQLVGEQVTLGNHQLAKFEDGTVVRALGV